VSVAARVVQGVAIALVALLVAACQTTTTTQPGSKVKRAKPSDPNAPQTFFWEVEGSDGARFYLLGSVHLGDARGLVLDPQIERDWNASEELVVQLDAAALSEIDTIGATHRYGLLPEPKTLQQVVRADTYQQLAAYMKQRGYDMDRVDQMRPWLAAHLVTGLELDALGLDSQNGVESFLRRRAQGSKPVGSLASLEEEMALFGRMPDGLQETWLVESLREAPKFLDVSRAILAAWERGDDAEMERLLFGSVSDDPQVSQFYASIFQARNPALADRLAALASDGKPRFVVIHTGHLIGRDGVPELLAQRGYRVLRIGSARVMRDPTTPVVTRTRVAPSPASSPRPAATPPAAAAASTHAPASVVPVPVPADAAAPAAPASVGSPAPLPAASAPAPAPAPAAAPPAEGSPEAWLSQDAAPAAPIEVAPEAGSNEVPAAAAAPTAEAAESAPAKPKRPRFQTKLRR
jgi:uncharacterized protein YbaP (TraB family)